ncbi:MAG: DNA-binding protein [Lachnospiraceae bacterium]|nr:DNA-binding protein [Lachnospiraceae bacterium]
MEKIFEQALLYDFYGELLTEHQRSIYEDAVYNDMSLGEIAEQRGISRQGVHDLIKRCDKSLQEYEAKLHLVERFARAKGKIQEIENLTEQGAVGVSVEDCMKRIRELAEQLLGELV